MIDISLKFGADNLAENLTFVLAHKDNSKIGLLSNPQDVTASISCEEAPGISVKFYKTEDNPYWDDINMFKLIYVPELDTYYAIQCETSESDSGIYKALTLTRLEESELSQINVYGLQINTEEEIILPDYDSNFPNVLYRDPTDIHAYDDIWNSDEKYEDYTDAQKSDVLRHSSILHRVLSFAPHYSIGTVDESIQNIQRIYTFDSTSVYDCLNQIAEDMSIIFDFSHRTVSAYDALTSCDDCGYRGHFTGTCPNCGGSNLTDGFGEDTGICIGADALGTDITYQRNEDALCNCYHVVGGDDIMTAAIRNCNPNGGYVWSFSDETKSEMSSGLQTALSTYETLYDDYQTTHVFDVSGLPLTAYNNIITKYAALDTDFKYDELTSITGYSELIKAYYDAIDIGEYLNHSLYPSITNNGKTAAQVVAGLTQATLSPVSMLATDGITLASASNAVLSYARILSDPLFDIKVIQQDLVKISDVWNWVGILSATNYYDKDDTAKTSQLQIVINADVSNYAQNSVKQTLLNRSKGNAEIINLYNMQSSALTNALKYYSYQALSSISDCFVKAVEALTSIGADDSQSDAHAIYEKTQADLVIINTALAEREAEAKTVDFKDSTTSMVALLKAMIDSAKSTMNIENNLTAAQWIELNAFRRESDYSNDNYVSTSFRKKFDYVDSNYISDSLTNGELIKRAYEFLMMAEYKIKENNKYSYQISTSLQNLLAIPEFAGLRSSFKCGNWLRVTDTNGTLYKLRLIKYEIDFNDLSNISVEFADISLNGSAMNKMQKWMTKTWDVVDKFEKKDNQNKSNLLNNSGNLTNDYNYNDSYNYQTVEIMGGQMTTQFNVLDGLIEGKISMDQAMSLIAQELGKITLTVQNGNKASTLTILYDGVSISTSGNITLGGTVVFEDNLTDGQTIISGDNILTGEIMSANYQFRNGQIFSDHGSLFSLINGTIRTPHLLSNEDGLYVKGTIEADAGRIGGFDILTTGDSYALDHAQNAWKLRSAPIAGQLDTRYYVSLTKQRNLVVSNSKDDPHSTANDVSDECNIGTLNSPWHHGNFQRVYTVFQAEEDGQLVNKRVQLGTEYVKVKLTGSAWSSNKQTVSITGITKDDDIDGKIKQWVYVYPAYANAVDYFDYGIILTKKKKGQLEFTMTNPPETTPEDVYVYLYVTNAKPRTTTLSAPLNASIIYDNTTETTYVQWQDPDDEMFAVWDTSFIIRRPNQPPTWHFESGELVTDSDSVIIDSYDDPKSKYKTTAYEDTVVGTLPRKGRYYYSIVCATSEEETSSYTDVINTGDAPYISNIAVVDKTAEVSYDLQVATYKTLTVVYKVGSEPATIEDGITIESAENITCDTVTSRIATATNLPVGTLYFKIFSRTDGGISVSNTVTATIVDMYDFDYTGTIQTFTAPQTGVYQIESWGAQGGDDGGLGGYAIGETILSEGETVYVVVGGQNGFNGGGLAPWDGSEIDIMWSGNNNKMTVQVANSHVVFTMYIGNAVIYTFNAAVGTTISDINKINIGFLKDTTNEVAKPSFIYDNGNNTYSYNQETPTDAEMELIYMWLSGESIDQDYTYTGEIQTFTAPKTGIYSLETWGAQGGNASDGTNSARGGYGAYAYGEVLLNQGDTLYIGVGGQNGWNGGGRIVKPLLNATSYDNSIASNKWGQKHSFTYWSDYNTPGYMDCNYNGSSNYIGFDTITNPDGMNDHNIMALTEALDFSDYDSLRITVEVGTQNFQWGYCYFSFVLTDTLYDHDTLGNQTYHDTIGSHSVKDISNLDSSSKTETFEISLENYKTSPQYIYLFTQNMNKLKITNIELIK